MELSKFLLPTGETISCVLWNELYHITGTDIVRSLVSRFESFGRPVRNIKKFEEGVFSDLRNLKPGADACLEEPKSPFLEMLYRNNCIRTQKKQKVFYWYSVPHDRLFLDAMERDLKREQAGTEPTSQAVAEPALSCTLETVRELVESLSRRTIEMNTITETLQSFTPDGIAPLTRVQPSVTPSAVSPEHTLIEGLTTPSGIPARQDSGSFADVRAGYHQEDGYVISHSLFIATATSDELIQPLCVTCSSDDNSESKAPSDPEGPVGLEASHASDSNSGLFGSFTLFEGSPTYKKRRRRSTANPSLLSESVERATEQFANGKNSMGDRHFYDYDKEGDRYLEESVLNGSRTHTGGPVDYVRPHHQGSASMSSLNSIQANSGNSSRSYSCPVQMCGRLFKRLEHLKRHWRTHTLERPYACNICAKRFSRSDNLAAHRKTHDKPSWANDEDPSSARHDTENEDDLDQEDDHDRRLSKGYVSDNSISRKRRRFQADRGMESMSERESLSGHSSGDDEDDGAMMKLMELQGLNQDLQFQHRNGTKVAATSQQQQVFPAGMRQPVYPDMTQSFISNLGMVGQQFAPFAAPLSATFGGMFGAQAAPAPLFTLEEHEDEEDENDEITDMEKLRYKYEYEIKAAIDSTPVLAEVSKVMTTPYNTGAFGYGVGGASDYTSAYGAYPLATPVALGRYPYDASTTPASLNLFSAAMVPSSSSTSTSSISTAMPASSNYPIVHTSALPPSHHHQEYLEYTLGNMLTNMPV
ncbi:homeodomain transcription factor ste12 [Podila horticola]|nr:homeodomain transcription factor ste12 [Podila horticola]